MVKLSYATLINMYCMAGNILTGIWWLGPKQTLQEVLALGSSVQDHHAYRYTHIRNLVDFNSVVVKADHQTAKYNSPLAIHMYIHMPAQRSKKMHAVECGFFINKCYITNRKLMRTCRALCI